jgi:hypothetical protein
LDVTAVAATHGQGGEGCGAREVHDESLQPRTPNARSLRRRREQVTGMDCSHTLGARQTTVSGGMP